MYLPISQLPEWLQHVANAFPLAHLTDSINEETLDVVINFTVKDRDGDAQSGSLTVKVNDDTPVTTNDTASVNEGAKASLDLVIVIDRSGSMDAQSGVTTQFGTTRIAHASRVRHCRADEHAPRATLDGDRDWRAGAPTACRARRRERI